jgi:DNA polymerase-1
VERCLALLEAIGVPVVGAEGFEADDVIAAIATRYSAAHPEVRVRIVSKDKDLKQLLGGGPPGRRCTTSTPRG